MLRFILFASLIVSNLCLLGQKTNSDQIADAIRKGNARALAGHFAHSVDLTIAGVEEVYSKEQAEVILSKFFADNPPKSFQIRHEGRSKMDDHFFIADMVCEKKSYRVTYFLKMEENAFHVKQLRFELE